MPPRRKICVVLVDRANYGRMKSVMKAIQESPDLELQIVCTGTMLLERFGEPVRVVEADGFNVDGRLHVELEGSIPTTMAKSVGFAVIEFATEFRRLMPDIVLLIGDRYEALAATISAAYMNITVAHIQGGEVSGSIDESARHAITRFAHYHFPATKRAADYLVRMGEKPETILTVGCPSSDLARDLDTKLDSTLLNEHGRGVEIEITKPFLLVVFHPTTTEFGGEVEQIDSLLGALNRVRVQTVFLWPNIDAGADHISKRIREFRERPDVNWMRNVTNFKPDDYLKILASAACAVGNSSSFVRDAGYFGTPIVLVGNRQEGREWGNHVRWIAPDEDEIVNSIQSQLRHGHYPSSSLYGDGYVAGRIAEALVGVKTYSQKRLHYIYE